MAGQTREVRRGTPYDGRQTREADEGGRQGLMDRSDTTLGITFELTVPADPSNGPRSWYRRTPRPAGSPIKPFSRTSGPRGKLHRTADKGRRCSEKGVAVAELPDRSTVGGLGRNPTRCLDRSGRACLGGTGAPDWRRQSRLSNLRCGQAVARRHLITAAGSEGAVFCRTAIVAAPCVAGVTRFWARPRRAYRMGR